MKKFFKKIVLKIITLEAKVILRMYKPKIIAITGSVGKTSGKDALYTVLSQFFSVRKNEKSFNSEIGIPLTIIGCPNGWNNPVIWIENILKGLLMIAVKTSYPEYLILEVGAGKPNDIKNIVKWVKPDVAIITRFPDTPVHIEFFGTVEKVIEEKMSLAYALKDNGLLILNNDDKAVINIANKVKRRTVSYGMGEHATYRALYPALMDKEMHGVRVPAGMSFKLEYSGNTFPAVMENIIGESHIYTGLLAIACAHELGAPILESVSAVRQYRTPPGRLSVIEGMNGSMIIDDTYNSSPVALEAGLKVLESINAKRKIAVLGDMLELGKYTEDAHKDIGQKVKGVVDMLVVVGPRAKFIKDGAEENGFNKKEIYEFDSSVTVGKFLEGVVEKGDVVFIKGSQGVRLERAVEAIMAHKKDAKKLLCRQEKEWKRK